MKFRFLLLAFILTLIAITAIAVRGQEPIPTAMSLSGGGNTDYQSSSELPGREENLRGFLQAAQAQAQKLGQSLTHILIIPTARISNPFTITQGERENLTAFAEAQADSLEDICLQFSTENSLPCQATVLPVFMRSDAASIAYVNEIADSLSAIYFLDGSPLLAMRNLANTPLERVIADAYQRGVLIAGDGNSANMQSFQLLVGYQSDFAAENALAFGASDLRTMPRGRGLIYGLDHAIIQSELFFEGRLGLLLNALIDPASVNVGLGIDRHAGVDILDGDTVTRIYGKQTAVIMDAETYHAADSAQYHGSLNYLSLRNVLVHALTAGDLNYDFATRSSTQFSTPQTLSRRFETLRLPSEAGSLYLLSNITQSWNASILLNQFLNEAGGQQARVLHLLLGYPNQDAIQAQIDFINQMLGVDTLPLVVTPSTPPGFEPNLTDYDAIMISLADRQRFPELSSKLGFLRAAWFAGKPILAAGEATPILGTNFWINPYQSSPALLDPELAHFDPSQHVHSPGLNLLPANIEVGVTNNNRWGGLFSLAYRNPTVITLGMADQTAIVLQSDLTIVQGENIVASLDLRNATIGEQDSNIRFANGLLDVFAPGDLLEPRDADAAAAPIPAATPIVTFPSPTPSPSPTITATPEPTNTPRVRPPTRTPRPSPTTPASPPPRNPTTSNLMVFLSLLMVVVIILGVLINRPRYKTPQN